MTQLLGFLEGPAWYAALAVFAGGTAWRLGGMLSRGRAGMQDARRAGGTPPLLGALRGLLPRGAYRGTAKARMALAAGLVFHLALFAVILLGEPHLAFLRAQGVTLPWAGLPLWAFVVIAEIATGALLLLWIRRGVDPVTRAISRPDDYWAAALTMAVLLTGCFALGGDQPALRALHMASVNAWLIYFPFGSLFHAFSWAFSRGFTGAMAARRGIRT